MNSKDKIQHITTSQGLKPTNIGFLCGGSETAEILEEDIR